MDRYCVQCKYVIDTDESNLYKCGVLPYNVCGETIACIDFEEDEHEVNADV
jgi:hypothetical protein